MRDKPLVSSNAIFVCKLLAGFEATANEHRPQSDRERLLESQLICVTKQYRSRTALAMSERTALEEECRQAAEQLVYYQDQSREDWKRSEEIFLDVEHAEQQLVEQRQRFKQRQDQLEAERNACEVITEHLGGECMQVFIGWMDMWKSQKSTRDRFKAMQKEILLAGDSNADIAVSEARLNQSRNTLLEMLITISSGIPKWIHEQNMSRKRIAVVGAFEQDSAERQDKIKSLLHQREATLKRIMQPVDAAELAAQKQLIVAVDRKIKYQEELSMSSERLKSIHQQISLVAKRQRWLDELKSTCGELRGDPELFQQTSSERDDHKKQLQQVLKKEEHLSVKLRETYEREKETRKKLKTTCERVKNIRGKNEIQEYGITNELTKLIKTETKLQGYLREAVQRETCVVVTTSQVVVANENLREDISCLCDACRLTLERTQQKKNNSG